MMMVLLLLHENDVYVCHKKVKWHIMHIQEVYVIMIDGYIFLNKQWDRYWQSIWNIDWDQVLDRAKKKMTQPVEKNIYNE